MEYLKKNIWILIFLCCLLIIWIPIKIPNNITAYAKIIPSKEFIVIKGSNGQIISHLVNNYNGMVEEVKTIQVDREDFASLSLNISTSNVLKGDTVAIFSSSHTNFIIEEVKGEILEEEKFLLAQLSGAKESLITEQEKNYEISKINYFNEKPIFVRKTGMFKHELISEEEFDLAKNLLEKFRLEVEREYQKLQVLKTGAKTEDIFLTKEKIKSLKKQKEVLENRISDYKIVAPFDGIVLGTNSLDTLFTISKTNSYAVLVPINVDVSNSIKIGQSINFLDSDSLYNIKIETEDPQSKMINGQNYFIYKSYFQTDKKVFSGIYECTIVGEERTIFDILKEKIYSIFNFL